MTVTKRKASKKKSSKLDLSSTSMLTLPIEGIDVKVRLDANGWPLSAWSTPVYTDERERVHRKAMFIACTLAERTAEARREAERIQKSIDEKRVRALDLARLTHEWLAAAHEKHPDFGAEQLAHAARSLLADHNPDDPVRGLISEHRAKRYLEAKKESGET